jgi:hypothetical protein
VRSRNGSDLARAFPEIEEAVRLLPDDTAVDCELIVWEACRLAFERLQQHLHHRSAGAAHTAVEFPAHLVAFGLLRLCGQDLTGHPFSERYAALEALFLWEDLSAPWSLCPTTTDPAQAAAGWPTTRPPASRALSSDRWQAGTCRAGTGGPNANRGTPQRLWSARSPAACTPPPPRCWAATTHQERGRTA